MAALLATPQNNFRLWGERGSWSAATMEESLVGALNAAGVLPAVLALQRSSSLTPERATALAAQLGPQANAGLFATAGEPGAARAALRAYVTAATLRDCSLLLRIEAQGGGRALAHVHLIDLDPKPYVSAAGGCGCLGLLGLQPLAVWPLD